ncbi:MAG: ABC transporter ATP-binding protein [Candidatus Parcubacteria bacterium]|nr:ABC transporter ATP-binding protein [Candidatus Parcubacteria bacterium]
MSSQWAYKFLNNPAYPDIIELKGITQIYSDKGQQKVVIDDLNMLVEQIPPNGSFVVILGKSGCGKSTLLRYIAGLQKPTKGEILINEKPQTDEHPISMVFQQYSSFPWYTVLQNVMLPLLFQGHDKKEAAALAMAMIQEVGLQGHEYKYAQYPILSGGQLQRVAIARSLVSNPSIILMDEPFGALDTNTRFQMQLMLARIWLKIKSTIILVTHDINEAVFLADWIYIMKSDPGEIAKVIKIDLPLERGKETKRTPEFIKLVQQTEDALWEVINGVK